MPEVSVIIPNYNHAPFLRQRIQSVLDQTFTDHELILLDDASTDNSLAILKEYALHPKVSCALFSTQNSGSTFSQWINGARLAKGKYLWIAESDDYADPHFLERCVSMLGQYPQAGLVYCQSYQVDEKGNVTGTIAWWNNALDKEKWARTHCATGPDEVARFASQHNIIFNASSVLVRTETFVEALPNGLQNYRLCGDWLAWVSVMQRSDVLFIAENLNYYRFHAQNVRTSAYLSSAALYEMFNVRRYIWKNFTLTANDRRNSARALLQEWKNWVRNSHEQNIFLRFITSSFYMLRRSVRIYTEMLNLMLR